MILVSPKKNISEKVISENYTLDKIYNNIIINNLTSDITVTVPSADNSLKNFGWKIMRNDNSNYSVFITLENPADSMFGSQFHTMKMTQQGEAISIINRFADNKYIYSDISGLMLESAVASVTTTLPMLASDQLTMNGEISSFGANTEVYISFRYREEGSGTWLNTSEQTKTTADIFTETVTVTAGLNYEVQSVLKDMKGIYFYGGVKLVSVNYYANLAIAQADYLEYYLPLQETSGTDTTGQEIVNNKDMTFYNGVTIGADIINGNTVYKRVFGTDDYGESAYLPAISTGSYSVLLQIKYNLTSGDHSFLHFGTNILSIAGDGNRIQLSVNGSIQNWSGASPTSGVINLFIIVDNANNTVTLFETDDTTDNQRLQFSNLPSADASYTRLARGASGDSNQQNYEYLDDGEIRSLAIWNKALTQTERINICKKLNSGYLILA